MTRFPKLRSLLINLLVVIISCLVALLILEGVVRLTTTPVYPLLQTDAAVGTIHIKNFEGRVWNDESKSENYIVTNNDGYIGPNYALKKASTTYRIALLGDSMTEGVQVDWYRTFGHVFEDLANVLLEKKSGMHIEAMNFGVGGTGTFLQYQTYKQNVAKYHPDAVVLEVSANDFSDNLNKINFDPEHYSEGAGRNTGLKSFLLRFQLFKFLFGKLQHSTVFLSFLNKLGLYEFNNYTDQFMHGGTGTEQQKAPEYYSFTFDLLQRLDERVTADGAHFVVFFVTDPKEDDAAHGYWEKDPDMKKLIAFMKEKNIEYYNIGPSLAKVAEEEGSCLNFDCAGHFTELGHRAIAGALLEYAQSHFCLWDKRLCGL